MNKTSLTKIISIFSFLLVFSSNNAVFSQNQDSTKTIYVPQKPWFDFVQNYKNIEVSPEKADWHKDKTITFLFSFSSSNLLQLKEVTGVTDQEVLDALFSMPIEVKSFQHEMEKTPAFAVKMLNKNTQFVSSMKYYRNKGIHSIQAEPVAFSVLHTSLFSWEWNYAAKQGHFLGATQKHFSQAYGAQMSLGAKQHKAALNFELYFLRTTLTDTVVGDFELQQRDFGNILGFNFNFEYIFNPKHMNQIRLQAGIGHTTFNIFQGETEREKADQFYEYEPFEGIMFVAGLHFVQGLGKPKYDLYHHLIKQPYVDFFATIQPYFLKTKGLNSSIFTIGAGFRFERTTIKAIILN